MRSFQMATLEEAVQLGQVTSGYILHSQHTAREPLAIQNVTTLPNLFKWQAQRRCGATLFSFRFQPDADLTTISYTEAYETSSQLANCLYSLHRNAGTESPVVGIWLERSIDLHLAILASTIFGATVGNISL
jgi:acyl-coenzyme A synthetase/AMP-(fatty) acid ligase